MEFAPSPNDVFLFDFSGTRRAQNACAFLANPDIGMHNADVGALVAGDPQKPREEAGSSGAMVVLVGDALMEPFWPEGLGIVRGFHSVLDATAAINVWGGKDTESARSISMRSFGKLKGLNGSTAQSVLQPDIAKYCVHPSTRYR